MTTPGKCRAFFVCARQIVAFVRHRGSPDGANATSCMKTQRKPVDNHGTAATMIVPTSSASM